MNEELHSYKVSWNRISAALDQVTVQLDTMQRIEKF